MKLESQAFGGLAFFVCLKEYSQEFFKKSKTQIMKKLLILVVPILFLLGSCSNEDEPGAGIGSEEASAMIHSTTSQVSGDITDLAESEGVLSLVHLLDLLEGSSVVNGRTNQQKWTNERIKIIAQYFIKGPAARVGANNENSLANISGLYEWNFETNDFDYAESDFFIVRFPTEGSSTNNAEFKISALEMVTLTDEDGYEEELPSLLDAYLKVDEVTLASLSLDVDWTESALPEKAEVSLYLAPFEFTIGFDGTFELNSSLLVSAKKNDEIITAIDVDVQFQSSEKIIPALITGNVQYRQLKIDGNIDLNAIGLDADPNDFINLALYSGDDKIGDIVFVLEEVEPGYNDYVAYVQYADGTLENLEELLEPVFSEIESLLEDF